MRKLLLVLALIFAVVFVVKSPVGAAALTRGVGAGVVSVANGLGAFATALAGKH